MDAGHGAVIRLPVRTAVRRLIAMAAVAPDTADALPQVTRDRLIIFTSHRCVGWSSIAYLDMVCTYMSHFGSDDPLAPGTAALPCPQHAPKHPSVRSRRCRLVTGSGGRTGVSST
jgi:hypothetical protein